MTSQPQAAAKMATAEMKACPFCGGEARLDGMGYKGPADCIDVVVACTKCDAMGAPHVVDHSDGGDEEQAASDAVAAWNKRAAPARDAGMAAEVERLTRQVGILAGWLATSDNKRADLADANRTLLAQRDAADRAGFEREAALKKSLTALCEILESDEGGGVSGCIGSMNPFEHEVGIARLLAPAAIDEGTQR